MVYVLIAGDNMCMQIQMLTNSLPPAAKVNQCNLDLIHLMSSSHPVT